MSHEVIDIFDDILDTLTDALDKDFSKSRDALIAESNWDELDTHTAQIESLRCLKEYKDCQQLPMQTAGSQ